MDESFAQQVSMYFKAATELWLLLGVGRGEGGGQDACNADVVAAQNDRCTKSLESILVPVLTI